MPKDETLRRQRSLSAFGVLALTSNDLNALLTGACSRLSHALGANTVRIALLRPGGKDFVLLAATGHAPAGDAAVIPGGRHSACGYAVETGAPVVSQVDKETRFAVCEHMRRSGARVTASVAIWADGRAQGCLEAGGGADWQVGEADIHHLQSYANVLGAAIERHRLAAERDALLREREVLIREVHHRVKNLLANVAAIAHRTRRHSNSLDQFLRVFDGRLQALSRAHDLVVSVPEKPVSLRELLQLEFAAKGLIEGEQFSLAGEDLVCPPQTVQPLALLLFELATNSAKYGAASRAAPPDSHIDVRWRVAGGSATLIWRETGIDRCRADGKRGFGTELIERIVPQMLDGSARWTLDGSGVECRVTFPVRP